MNVQRSSQQRAIILRITPFGDTHALVDLLTDSAGLVPSVAWGLRSKRSSLRGRVVPFARGTVWLYRSPRDERAKITDFEVLRYAQAPSASLEAYYHASLWCELVARTYGVDADAVDGQGSSGVYALVDEALSALEVAMDGGGAAGVGGTGGVGARDGGAPGQAGREVRAGREGRAARTLRRLSIGVLWKYLDAIGAQASPTASVITGREFAPDQARYYSRRELGFVAAEQAPAEASALGGGAARFLSRASGESLGELVRLDIGEQQERVVLSSLLAALNEATGVDLNTVRVAGRYL